MSPRRKAGLSPADLQALKHLPAVLTALEHLQEQHAKVRALMGGGDLDAEEMARAEREADMFRKAYFTRTEQRLGAAPDNQTAGQARPGEVRPVLLDTPERREHEAAKAAGRKVPAVDPFANAGPAQRERMAEQRAIIEAERAAKGPRAHLMVLERDRRVGPDLSAPDATPAGGISDGDPDTGLAVRTEALETLSDGTTPLAEDADHG